MCWTKGSQLLINKMYVNIVAPRQDPEGTLFSVEPSIPLKRSFNPCYEGKAQTIVSSHLFESKSNQSVQVPQGNSV